MVERPQPPRMPLITLLLEELVTFACLFSHPLDTLKVRSQLKGEMSNVKRQGVRAMFNVR